MDFLEKGKYAKIKQLAEQGDKNAKDFLFNFMEMNDEDANAYLSTIEFDESDWKKIIEDLIKDENEAIDGYDKAIKYLANTDGNEAFISVLEHIKQEEIEHIEELKELL